MIDKHSETWRTVVEKAAARIERLRDELERSVSEQRTTEMRATLSALREVLTWADAAQDIQTEELRFTP